MDAKFMQELQHRITFLDKQSRELKTLEKKVQVHSAIQKSSVHKEIDKLTAELDDIEKSIKECVHLIHQMGQDLRNRIRKQEFVQLREGVQSLDFEHKLRRTTLRKDFATYSGE